MEIKIQCGCGSRFAFEVQPVHGRMPTPVSCPRCGCDQTEQANRLIASKLAPPPLYGGRRGLKILNLPGYNHPEPEPDQVLVSIPQPGMQSLPVGGKTNHTTALDIPITDNSSAAPHLQDAVDAAMASSAAIPIIPSGSPAPAAAASAPAAPAAPAPGGLKVRHSKKAETTTVIHPPPLPTADITPSLKRKPVAPAPAYDDDPPQGVIGWLKVSGKAIFGTALALLFVLKLIGKFKIAKLLAIFGIGTATSTSDLNLENWNFGYEDTTQIYVQVDDPKKVVEACVTYWSAQGKTLTVKQSDEDIIEEKHYIVTPAHQGYVAILGELSWDPKFVDGLALNLSTSLGSTVITYAESDFSGAHRFAVYQSGQKSFSHQYDVQINGNKVTDSFKVEGENWVTERGYFKPDRNGFENFDIEHINFISQQLGLQWWNFPLDAKGFHDLSE